MMFHSDSEVQEIARNALKLLKEQETYRKFYADKCDELYAVAKSRVEVVRCRDCKYCYYASNRVPDERSFVCEKHGIDITANWFCADGKR